MTELKTRPTGASVTAFVKGIEDPKTRRDINKIAAMMRRATGARARMWGPSIVGYGRYHYEYASGRSGDWMLTGYSPRKSNISIYVMSGFESFASLMQRLGKYKTGRSCLYVKRLSDVDEAVLEQLISRSVDLMRERYLAR